ncbi:MAG: DUF4261 domain-containing protein [Haliscomenobacteraceae bacterium CHB4]|nr:hypothetical protein [Saprospiraceae bacterium]MCE7924052.1 DUF4261 domain-containing protein [Haliscomenobacteraceae bacterium CHB4]
MRLFILLLAFNAVFSLTTAAQKKDQAPATEQKIVSGTILLNDKTIPNAQTLLASLRKDWKIKTDSSSVAEKTIVFTGPGAATVMIAFLDYPVPAAEIATAARISWLWKNGADEALRHQSQAVISVVGKEGKSLDLHKLFTSVAGGVLENTNSCGTYMADQYLLLSKGFYTSAARNMRDNQAIPLYCWVYFGMTQDQELNSGYTWGLQEFGLAEMEIVRSKQSLADVHATLYDAALTVVQYNLKLQDGQSFTTVDGQKWTVKRSKAVYQEGETLKIDY